MANPYERFGGYMMFLPVTCLINPAILVGRSRFPKACNSFTRGYPLYMNAIKSKGSFGSQVRSIGRPYVIPVVKFAPMRLDLPIIDSYAASPRSDQFLCVRV